MPKNTPYRVPSSCDRFDRFDLIDRAYHNNSSYRSDQSIDLIDKINRSINQRHLQVLLIAAYDAILDQFMHCAYKGQWLLIWEAFLVEKVERARAVPAI